MSALVLNRFSGGNPEDWIFQAEQYFTYLGFPEKDWLPLPSLYLDARTSPKSHVVHSQLTNILTLLQKVQDNLDKIHISTPGTPNHTSLSPTIIQEVPVENAHSGHVDQVFDESFHQITDSVHEFGTDFDLVLNISDGLQIPLQVTQVISKPTWCGEPEIDCSDDTYSRKSISEEDECLDPNTSIVFDGSLQRNEFHLQCQFAHLKIIMTEKSIFHMNLPSNFNGPTRVEGEASLIPHVDDALIAEFFPSITTQSSLADFGDLAKYEIMKDGLPTFYWFDAGQHLSLLIPFVFRHIKCGGLLYVLEFRNIGDHLAAFDAQDGGVMIIGRDATLLSGDAHRKYMWCFEFVVMKLSSLSARTQFWTVNSYISGIIEHQTIGVDICDISSNLASLTSSADILFETFLFTPIVRCQKTVECLMIFDKIPQRCVVCWIEWIEAYERAENCDGVFNCYASPFIDLFLDSHPLCYCTPCDRQYGYMASYKVIKILFLGHPKEEVESYLAKDVAFSEHVLVGSSYSVWEIILFYGTWFQLFGLVAARRHFKSSSGTHTADLGRRKQQTKQLADKHCDQELLRRFFGHQSSAARSIKNSRHVRKFFVYVQPWAFDNVVVGARLYNSNLEDKVLIGAGGIVMNGPRPVLAKQPKSILSGYVWDPLINSTCGSKTGYENCDNCLGKAMLLIPNSL
ncbi:hypothetical protein BC332_27118 [Capsicum chinense]|nr:hypothetical protein BC332_27118 [Capsicum chinense]